MKTSGFGAKMLTNPSAFDIQTNSLVTVNESGTITLHAVKEEGITQLRSFDLNGISSLDFNGLHIVYGQTDGRMDLLNILSETPKCVKIGSESIDKVMVTFDDKVLSWSSGAGDLKLWDMDGLLESNENEGVAEEKAGNSGEICDVTDVGAVAFTPTSKDVVLGECVQIT